MRNTWNADGELSLDIYARLHLQYLQLDVFIIISSQSKELVMGASFADTTFLNKVTTRADQSSRKSTTQQRHSHAISILNG